jgi:hypothetical protein
MIRNTGRKQLHINNGDLTFTEKAAAYGLMTPVILQAIS